MILLRLGFLGVFHSLVCDLFIEVEYLGCEFIPFRVALEQATDTRQLTRQGRVTGSTTQVETVIRAPAAGTVLSRAVEPQIGLHAVDGHTLALLEHGTQAVLGVQMPLGGGRQIPPGGLVAIGADTPALGIQPVIP